MLGGLMGAIEELAGVDPASLGDAELHEVVTGLMRAESLFAGLRARHLAAWETRRGWADDGSKAAAPRLARECGLAPVTARRELRRARRLAALPAAARAVRDGKLSIDQADLIVHADEPQVRALLARDEGLLVEQLQTLRYPDCARLVRYWQHHAHDELDIAPASRGLERRALYAVRTMHDMVVIDGQLDTMNGTVFLNELARLEQPLFDADWAHAREQHGTRSCAEQLPRTAAQRRADALVEMARRSASQPDHALPARPLITVVTGYETFTKLCELADGTVITPDQIIPFLGAADIERIVFDGPSRVIDVGVRRRFFTGALRRAIEIRDRHCQHPSGCDTPAEHCQIDHITPYSHGGLTTQDNGRCYCKAHNRQRVNANAYPPDSPDPPDDGGG